MAITNRTRKILWAKAGGRCSMCAVQLVTEAFETDDPSVVGEEAHIVARSPGGARANSIAEIDAYDNLILLCRKHHKQVDDQRTFFTVERLQNVKRDHERWIASLGNSHHVSEMYSKADRRNYQDEQRWADVRRVIYRKYLESVRPWMHHVRHWTGPYWDPDTTTKESLVTDEGKFNYVEASRAMSDIELELNLIASEDVKRGVKWLHAQLFAFEATVIADDLGEINTMGQNCESAHNWLQWAFRADLDIFSPEPSKKPPGMDEKASS